MEVRSIRVIRVLYELPFIWLIPLIRRWLSRLELFSLWARELIFLASPSYSPSHSNLAKWVTVCLASLQKRQEKWTRWVHATLKTTYRREQNFTHPILVKYYNDLLDRQRSERGKDEATYFYVGEVWNFFPEISEDFFLKMGILSPKVYTKNVPNIEVCNFILVPLRTQSIKQGIEVLY